MTESPPRPPSSRAHAVVAIAGAPLLLLAWRLAGTADHAPRLLAGGAGGLAPWLWQFGSFALLTLALPLLHVRVRRVAPLSALGWGAPAGARVWLLVLVAAAAAAGAGWHSASLPEIRAEYPMFRGLSARHDLVLPYEAAYVVLYYVAWESYFRGYLLFTVAPAFGTFAAVGVQALASFLVHWGKPAAEFWGSLPFGLAMGVVALRTRSFWPGFFVHATLGVSTDLFGLRG